MLDVDVADVEEATIKPEIKVKWGDARTRVHDSGVVAVRQLEEGSLVVLEVGHSLHIDENPQLSEGDVGVLREV